MTSLLKQKVNNLPRSPGIYKFFNGKGRVIYVGKAINLRSRVGSYFRINLDPRSKTYALVSEIRNVSHIETTSEIEALILEAALIKKYKPHYNINLKDNKSFLYIVVRAAKVHVCDRRRLVPSVDVARKQDLASGDNTFGPYPSSTITRTVVKTVRKLFPFRDCSDSKFARYHKLGRSCLYGHINVCPAPCVYFNDNDIRQYQGAIRRLKNFLSGKTSTVVDDLTRKMTKASKNQDYEEAARYRDLLTKFDYVRQQFHTPREFMENPYLVDDMAEMAIKELQQALPHLDVLPERIECYDISTISGKDAVGSMVVAIMGQIDKSEYRRFKIKLKKTPDDFDMMREVLSRRFKREVSSAKNTGKWGLPDLVVVDGGRGQVGVALEVLRKLNLEVPVIGLAKKEEKVVYFDEKGYRDHVLANGNLGLNLLIKLRDESHRFAQDYHHLLRKKSIRE